MGVVKQGYTHSFVAPTLKAIFFRASLASVKVNILGGMSALSQNDLQHLDLQIQTASYHNFEEKKPNVLTMFINAETKIKIGFAGQDVLDDLTGRICYMTFVN